MLIFEEVALLPGASPFSIRLHAGHSVAVMGRAGSGKSALLAAIRSGKPPAGKVTCETSIVSSTEGRPAPRETVQSLGKRLAKSFGVDRVREAIAAVGLTDVRLEPIRTLSASQIVAASLVEPLCSTQVALIDGKLDQLDTVSLETTLDLICRRTTAGALLLVATNRADVAQRLGRLIVLRSGSLSFDGGMGQLMERAGPSELIIESGEPTAVRALVEPFAIRVTERPGGLLISAPHGQELAAKLLTQGYGAVRAVLLREPTFGDALRTVL